MIDGYLKKRRRLQDPSQRGAFKTQPVLATGFARLVLVQPSERRVGRIAQRLCQRT